MPEAQSEAAKVFGDRLRQERNKRSLTLEDLGTLAEIHWTNVGKIERGQANPNLLTIVRLAGAMNVDPAELMRGITIDMVPNRTHRLTASEFIKERERRSKR